MITLHAIRMWLFEFLTLLIKSFLSLFLSIYTNFVSKKPKSIKKEIVLVVGAGRGIGRVLALQLGLSNAKVVCMDIIAKDNTTIVREISRNGGVARDYYCNLKDEEDILNNIILITKNLGEIGMVFLFFSTTCIIEMKLLQNKAALDISPYVYFLNSILPIMKRNKKGHIIFLSSLGEASPYDIEYRFQRQLNTFQLAIQEIYENVVKDLKFSKLEKSVKATLVQTFEPFIMYTTVIDEINSRIGWNFKVRVETAVENIIDGVRRNETEIYVPKSCFYISRVLRILPHRITYFLSDFWRPCEYFL